MIISHGNSTKRLNLYPPTKQKYEHENSFWIEDEEYENDDVKLVLSIKKKLSSCDQIEDDLINSFLNNVTLSSLPN